MHLSKSTMAVLLTATVALTACGGNKEAVSAEDELATARAENATNELFTPDSVDSVDIFSDDTRVYNRDAEGVDNDVFGITDSTPDPEVVIGDATLYFDYNSSRIRDDARRVVVANAQHLSSNPAATVVLEGHADERGTREYNIALGMRRAEAIRQLMMLYGVEPKQIRLTSYGEERPIADGHNEVAWAQNRRVELKYPY